MIVQCVANYKGGVGKTTTVFTLGHIAAAAGKRVLLLDMDAQGSLTGMATGDPNSDRSMANVLGGVLPHLGMPEVIKSIGERIDLVPGGRDLTNSEIFLVGKMRREHFLARALQFAQGRYDVVLIDTPPTNSLLTLNALAASQEVLIPTQAQALDLAGLQQFRELVCEVQAEVNPTLRIVGVVVTFCDIRLNEHQASIESIKSAGLPLCKTIVGRTIRIAEAAKHCQPITVYAAANTQATNYLALASELNLV